MRSTLPLFLFGLAGSTPAFAAEVVPLPHFDSVELRGGGNVVVIPGPAQRLTLVEGSTQFTTFHMDRSGQLKIDSCSERCPHSYRLSIRIESPRVPDLAVKGGGQITAEPGFRPQPTLSAAIDGGGKVDTRSLDAGQVSAAVNGGGDMLVRARSSLSAAVSGGGAIRYWGDPQVSMATRGGGSVRRGY
jgi:hypothetical protein